MIDYKLWQQRLIDELDGNSSVKKIGFAADIQAVLKNAAKYGGSIHVVPGSDNANGRADSTSQSRSIVRSTVQVLSIARDYSDARGDAATDKSKTITDLIYNALHGWTPADCIDSAHYKSGKFLGIIKGFIMWVETYETTQMRTAP